MASSSSNPHVSLEVREEYPYPYTYPYPSNVAVTSFISVKLSGKEKYGIWKTQMLCLLESHDMFGFIDGTLKSPQTSVSGKEKMSDHQTLHRLWRRSDALVKGWIFGSISEKTLTDVVDRLTEKLHQEGNAAEEYFSAKDVWDELQAMYAPAVLPQLELFDVEDEQGDNIWRVNARRSLHMAVLERSWDWVFHILSSKKVTVIDKITNNGNTALHVAVGATKKPEILEKMLGQMPENTQLMDVRNSYGSTLLHVAAITGNAEAARILVARNRDLLLIKDNEGHTPLAIALSNMHTETAQYLLQCFDTNIQKDTLFSGTTGDELLVTVISSKDFRLAKDLVRHSTRLNSDTVLMALAQNFPSGFDTLIYYIGSGRLFEKITHRYNNGLEHIKDRLPRWLFLVLAIIIILLMTVFLYFMKALEMLVWQFFRERIRIHDDAEDLLRNVSGLTSYHHYTNPILEASRQNAFEVVRHILVVFRNAILSANEDGHNIIQYAVIHRSEKVYNLVYRMSEHRNIYRTVKDSFGNNLLHLAARLAPSNKLNLISGAALQIQRELQWFKEVERFVSPLSIIQKNSFNETPQMVFTREHKDLVIEGEKWMKSTAESYTITAALIITIVFAAAITVPGGNNQDTGIPIFTNSTAFIIFAISDAISLFTAVTSLLMFLSILTARFAEHDFLYKLPTNLIIGLATLFISTTAMIIAFAATLYIVFGQNNSKILIPIVVLTCLPVTSFVTLQFPLVLELISSTYGRSIFGFKFIIAIYQIVCECFPGRLVRGDRPKVEWCVESVWRKEKEILVVKRGIRFGKRTTRKGLRRNSNILVVDQGNPMH